MTWRNGATPDYLGDDEEDEEIDARDAAGVGALGDIPEALTHAEKMRRVGSSRSPPLDGRAASVDKGSLNLVDAAKKAALSAALTSHDVQHHHKAYEKFGVPPFSPKW